MRSFGDSGLEVHILASGSDGNCSVVRGGDTTVMIDAGLSGSRIEHMLCDVGLDIRQISTILLTHEHRDHCMGVGILSRRHNIPVAGNEMTLSSCDLGTLGGMVVFQSSQPFRIGSMIVDPIRISHGAAEPNAFAISAGGRRCLFATDLGTVTAPISRALASADLVVLEANHDTRMLMEGSYPPFLKEMIRSRRGHLSNADCARALKATHRDGRKVFLAHLSRENNRPDVAKSTVAGALGCSPNGIDCLVSPTDSRSILLR